jgi:uroporphyrinogen decarboxylase
MNRRPPDRVPRQASFTPALFDRFREETGSDSAADYFAMEVRALGPNPTRVEADFAHYFPELPPGAKHNEWGMTRLPGTFHHFTRPLYPLHDAGDLADFESYPWPDCMEDYRYEGLEDRVRELHAADLYVEGIVGHIWEIAWQIRGMDSLMMDFFQRPELAEYLLDRITERQAECARRMALAGCDQVHLGDDVGMQDRLMMSPDTWRRWLKPRLRRVIEAAERARPGIHIWYHSDGMIQPIIPDLIEVGVTILNPVQPECMDPAEVKERYGDRLAFWGTIGTQTTMPFGSPDDVRAEVRTRIETVGRGGGLLLAPTHVLEPDVPWENVLAFFEAVDEFGRY